MARQQLPPQIKKIELARKVRGRPVVRYQLTVDIGTDPTTGRRKQYRKRFDTEEQARTELSKIQGEVAKGTHVHPLQGHRRPGRQRLAGLQALPQTVHVAGASGGNAADRRAARRRRGAEADPPRHRRPHRRAARRRSTLPPAASPASRGRPAR
ncbi:Arm DNA-binding domain-containing protein [Rhodococcus sp. M8-20]|uniref:Arm DNA-binding domain-containing protein n=1 Tax=Rhodococcus sp. M8-20 TaxID=3058375 RepID=UPI002ED41F50